jgi:hypothetical protein
MSTSPCKLWNYIKDGDLSVKRRQSSGSITVGLEYENEN